ncbi:MAG: response regulator [Labilithrix sp.]|nr:response regulator [Labilithrix sp.]
MDDAPLDVDVLVVDDDYDIRDTMQEVLAEHGLRVAAVPDGHQALAWLRANAPPRMILLDLMMPNCDGATFRAEQLAEPDLRHIPVVLVTADRHPDAIGKKLAVDGWLTKPVDLATLLATVRRHCSPRP